MKKIFYAILIIVILLVGYRLLQNSASSKTEVSAAATGVQTPKEDNDAMEDISAVITEDSDGNMSVDGQPVEDIVEENPEHTADEEETIIQE